MPNQQCHDNTIGCDSRFRNNLTLANWINVTPTDVSDIDEFTIGDSAAEPSYDIS